MGLCTPAIPEKSYGYQKRTGYHERYTELWLSYAVVAFLECTVYLILARSAYLGAKEESYAERDIVETPNTDAFVVFCFPQRWEGGEHQVHETVEVGHVDSQDLYDNLGAEEFEGSYEGDAESSHNSSVRVIPFGVESFIAGLFDKFLLFSVEKNRRVGFLKEEQARDLNKCVRNSCCVEYPSPGSSLGNESSCDRPNSRA